MDDGRCVGIVYRLSSIVSAFASDRGSLYNSRSRHRNDEHPNPAEGTTMAHEPDQLPASDTPSEPTAPAPVTVVVEAIYQDGVIKPLTPLDLPPDTPLCLHITTRITASVRPKMDGDGSASPALAMPLQVALPRWNPMRERLLRARETLAA